GPQLAFCCVQLRGVHVTVPPQTFGWPPPPHTWLLAQLPPLVPHCTRPPQPSAIEPQFWPFGHDVFGMHALVPPHLLSWPPPPHVGGAVHVPQWSPPPQPSP